MEVFRSNFALLVLGRSKRAAVLRVSFFSFESARARQFGVGGQTQMQRQPIRLPEAQMRQTDQNTRGQWERAVALTSLLFLTSRNVFVVEDLGNPLTHVRAYCKITSNSVILFL